jgi:hypothetical protein
MMIDQRLIDWVDADKENRSVSISYSKKDDPVRVFVATFEFGQCVGTSITDLDNIGNELQGIYADREREEFKRLQEKFA